LQPKKRKKEKSLSLVKTQTKLFWRKIISLQKKDVTVPDWTKIQIFSFVSLKNFQQGNLHFFMRKIRRMVASKICQGKSSLTLFLNCFTAKRFEIILRKSNMLD